ncbi:MAG: bifunctional phosphoglucose/phosphomannose isomerase [Saprospiraceae bacterium]|nr:bifunctional phosphoglucose/phosphomannose isomerase [Saprospiraceae bacterium]MBK6564757.1 bifunctional phosphoglucose/phosphomannose isomerase [Saprospiraceae bacterium]MBK8548873.1 bifunctional phosphoglucose/phosphomannose isomerase [Saprospiraceae bacterium]MBK8818986.1 bifunctional phosphoglucose/phosphomannose isomerase [Saprospiraceae bacterium]MBK8853541.1 bifunctional phosphoglucose/phosphomannose isomerase [Saprospiraceae bacterium]
METLIKNFPKQLKEAIEISNNLKPIPDTKDVREVLIVGMGGSGIGGDFVQSIVFEDCSVPVLVIKGYELPAFINENSLVIVSSYSGNTEETIHAFQTALQKKCRIVCLSSGGTIEKEALKNNIPFVAVPAGYPSPRACLGFSVVLQLAILLKYNLIKSSLFEHIQIATDLIKFEQDEIQNKAKTIAQQLSGKFVAIYSTDRFEPVALRFRQQLNENAKVLCWHNVFPEMNHNELVGWADKSPVAVVFLRNKDDLKKNIQRMDICKNIISAKTNTFIEIYSKGQHKIEKLIYMIHLVDWISFYLAKIRNVDVSEVKVIDFLKTELEKDRI